MRRCPSGSWSSFAGLGGELPLRAPARSRSAQLAIAARPRFLRLDTDLGETYHRCVHLRLQHLPEQCRCLSENHVANHVDAASVMLHKFHAPPAQGLLDDNGAASGIQVEWNAPDELLLSTHANELDATEDGAYAVAFATMLSKGFVVRRRAHHGSGSDYLMTRAGEPDNDFWKLEVSGVARPRDTTALRARLNAKLSQLGRGDLARPGVAVVVGFETVQIVMEEQT
jgi:hypothetical protein